jgi:hypothetical protein
MLKPLGAVVVAGSAPADLRGSAPRFLGMRPRPRRSGISSKAPTILATHAAYFATITGMPDPIDEHLFAVQREYDDLEAALLQMLPEFREYLAANDSDDRRRQEQCLSTHPWPAPMNTFVVEVTSARHLRRAGTVCGVRPLGHAAIWNLDLPARCDRDGEPCSWRRPRVISSFRKRPLG